MKFKDVREGSLVYIQSSLRASFGESIKFWLPERVNNVTPKRFSVKQDVIYRKSDGKCLGGGYDERARNLGDECYSGEVVTDQTEAMNLMKSKLMMASEINHIFRQSKTTYLSPNLDAIREHAMKIKHLLQEGEKP